MSGDGSSLSLLAMTRNNICVTVIAACPPLSLRHVGSGRAARGLPELRGGRLPVEGVMVRAMLLEMRQPRDGLLDARPMANGHPPQHDGRPLKMLEPVGTAAIEALVDGLPDKALERVNALPDRKIDDDPRVGIRTGVGRIAALVDIAPDEPGAALGNAVHQCKIVSEIRHARVVELVANAADVELGKMMVGRLLQVCAPSQMRGGVTRFS